MLLIVGLGNPGIKYKNTRHNVGFRAVDEITANFQFPIFNFQSIFNAQISKGEISGQKVILVKPQTFMNLSGKSVKLLNSKFKILNSKLFVIHDDIDLPLGKIRISKNRGAAGHKGVESIINELGTKNFVRFRIGIKPKQYRKLVRDTIEKFVLQRFNKDEEKIIKEVVKKTTEAIKFTVIEGIEKTMNRYNK